MFPNNILYIWYTNSKFHIEYFQKQIQILETVNIRYFILPDSEVVLILAIFYIGGSKGNDPWWWMKGKCGKGDLGYSNLLTIKR